MTISRYEKDGVDKEIDEEADVESSSSKSAAQADMEIATPRAEKNMEDDADDNVGTAMGEQALRINRSYQRHAPGAPALINLFVLTCLLTLFIHLRCLLRHTHFQRHPQPISLSALQSLFLHGLYSGC